MIIDNLLYEMFLFDFIGNLVIVIMIVLFNIVLLENVLEYKGEELVFVLDGKIILYLNEEEYVLEIGDSVKIFVYLKYKWVNYFEKNVVVLFFVILLIF